MATEYEIKIHGRIDDMWTNWFDGMNIAQDEDNNTLLVGELIDQAALHGLLKKIRDLGLTIVYVQQTNEVG